MGVLADWFVRVSVCVALDECVSLVGLVKRLARCLPIVRSLFAALLQCDVCVV